MLLSALKRWQLSRKRLLVLKLVAASAPDEETIGITDHSIEIGSCLPLTGTAVSERAKKTLEGATLYFNSINNEGGIHDARLTSNRTTTNTMERRERPVFEEHLKGKVFTGCCFLWVGADSEIYEAGGSE